MAVGSVWGCMSPVPGEPGRRGGPGAPRRPRVSRPGLPDHRGEAAADRNPLSRDRVGHSRAGYRIGLARECVFDAARDCVDRGCVPPDGVESAVFAPAGDVGDRLAADVEADVAEDAVGDAVDEDLAALAAELGVAEAVGVGELVK
jgi:hypothetical protein